MCCQLNNNGTDVLFFSISLAGAILITSSIFLKCFQILLFHEQGRKWFVLVGLVIDQEPVSF